MTRFKNRIVYDAQSGEIRDDRKFMTMLEDFWLPRREGGKGTEITTLPGGQNLGQIEDITYFQRKLYKSLNVPMSRLDNEQSFSLGRTNEITRDEIKFAKFINRLRNKFSVLFLKILERQLILKGLLTPEDWDEFKPLIKFKFSQDNYFAELKESEILNNRLASLQQIEPFRGTYYSAEWIRRNILRQTDEEMEEIDEQIADEQSDPQYNQALRQQMEMQSMGMDQQGQPQGGPQAQMPGQEDFGGQQSDPFTPPQQNPLQQ